LASLTVTNSVRLKYRPTGLWFIPVKSKYRLQNFEKQLLKITLCLGALGLVTLCCGSSGVRELIMVARYSTSDGEDHYILRMFFYFLASSSTFLNGNFQNFATWRGSSFNSTVAIGLPLRCPLEQTRGQKPQILSISGPDRNKCSAAVPQWGGK